LIQHGEVGRVLSRSRLSGSDARPVAVFAIP